MAGWAIGKREKTEYYVTICTENWKKAGKRRGGALKPLLGWSSEKELAVEKKGCLKIEKEIPCQLLNIGSIHG